MTTNHLTVSPWVVVMGIRYGLGRQTGAHGDAIDLIRLYWDEFDDMWRGVLADDMRSVIASTWMPDDVRQSTEAALAWTETQP